MSSTWKGRFDITHEDFQHRTFDGIQAYPPCKVHRKVYNLSKQLPEALQFELLPRLELWAKLFQDDNPGALDIGLYLFCSKRRNQCYTSLLEYLNRHDMLLRSQLDGVELLICSSKHLEADSQRVNRNFFLWGLFVSSDDNEVAKAGEISVVDNDVAFKISEKSMADNYTIASVVTENPVVAPGEEDMEIDMFGGYEVGTVDKIVPRPDTCPDSKGGDTSVPKIDDLAGIKKFKLEVESCINRIIELNKKVQSYRVTRYKEEP